MATKKKSTKSAAQIAQEEAVKKRLATTLANLKANYDTQSSQITQGRDNTLTNLLSNFNTQTAQVTGSRDATLADLAATLQRQNAEAEQGLQSDTTAMQESVNSDALRRGMMHSSLPITVAADKLAELKTAFTNAGANRQNTYNTNVSGVKLQADTSLANILNSYNQNKAETEFGETNSLASLMNQYNAGVSEAEATAAEYMANIMAQYAKPVVKYVNNPPTDKPVDYTKYTTDELKTAWKDQSLTNAERKVIGDEIYKRAYASYGHYSTDPAQYGIYIPK